MIFSDPTKAKAYIDKHATAIGFEITIQRKTRSLPQNKYYWGAVLPLLGLEWGYTVGEMHQLCKAKFLSYNKQIYNGVDYDMFEFTKSTTDLSTSDFETYLAKIRTFAGEHGVTVPLPNEDLTQLFEYLEQNRNFVQ